MPGPCFIRTGARAGIPLAAMAVVAALALPAGAPAALGPGANQNGIPTGPVRPSSIPTKKIRIPRINIRPVAPAGTTPAPKTSVPPAAATRTSPAPATPTAPVTPRTSTAPVTPVAPLPNRVPARAAAHHGGGLSTSAIILAAVAGLIALACAAWAVARVLAFEPHWALSARHVIAEAEFRASATWDEFSDWVRLGR